MLRTGGPGLGTGSLLSLPLGVAPAAALTHITHTTNWLKNICSPVAFNDIKHLARSLPADGLEAQDVVPPRCGCWVARMAIFSSRRCFWAKHTRSRPPSLAAPPVITWRLRLATVMAGLWSVVARSEG